MEVQLCTALTIAADTSRPTDDPYKSYGCTSTHLGVREQKNRREGLEVGQVPHTDLAGIATAQVDEKHEVRHIFSAQSSPALHEPVSDCSMNCWAVDLVAVGEGWPSTLTLTRLFRVRVGGKVFHIFPIPCIISSLLVAVLS